MKKLMKIKIEYKGDSYFVATLGGFNIGTLDIYTDDDGLNWANGIEVKKEYRRNGIATKLIKSAIKEFGEIYISTASQAQHNANNDNTARYLCDDGDELVKKLLERKVIKKKWMKNPFGNHDYL
jgi:hypothetical protein